MANNSKKINLKYRKELEYKINEFIEYLKYQHFSENIIKKYNSHLQKYYYYCINNNIKDFYSTIIVSKYLDSLYQENCVYFIKFAKKTLNKFIDFHFYRSFKVLYSTSSKSLTNLYYIDILNRYKNFLDTTEVKEITKKNNLQSVKTFLIYLENKNILTLNNDLLKSVIYTYVNTSTLSHATKSRYSKNLKKFFNFTFDNQLSLFSGNDIFPRIHCNERERILSFYSRDEVSLLFDAIDTSTSIGKRDYAIILLAATLGLRSKDIINLTLENVNFDKKYIKIIQQKTQKPLIQPFTEEILFALLDYLKNGRPITNSNFIFISHKAPFERISQNCIYIKLSKYFKIANIDISSRKHGLHSLRHSLANNMLHNNISLQDISATLGHSYISTTTMYTNIDLKTLKLLSLEVCE